MGAFGSHLHAPLHFSRLTTAAECRDACPLLLEWEESTNVMYPLGKDKKFSISHGKDYFAFFRRLGALHYFLTFQENKDDSEERALIGTGAAIKRRFGNHRFYYLCDLKTHPKARGQRLTTRLLMHWLPTYKHNMTGYLVSMDPSSIGVESIFASVLSISKGPKLLIYHIDALDMFFVQALFLEDAWGKISYLSLKGKKDLLLDGKEPMPIYHLQHGPFAEHTDLMYPTVLKAKYMFAVIQGSKLAKNVELLLKKSTITATVISRGMEWSNWNWILTSDI